MNSSRLTRFVRAALAAILVVAVASPVLGQNKKKKDQSEQAQKAIQKQKDIAKGLADKAAKEPATLQQQLDTAKQQLQAEKDRHTAALQQLNADLKAATDAGQNQKAKTAQKAIEKENEQHQKKLAELQKTVNELQAKVDAGKK